MSIRSQKKKADELMRVAEEERAARDLHLDRSLTMIEGKIITPAGLAACFGAGVALGLLTGRDSAGDDGDEQEGAREAKEKGGGNLADIAIKLASAMIVNALVRKYPDNGDPAAETAHPPDYTDSV